MVKNQEASKHGSAPDAPWFITVGFFVVGCCRFFVGVMDVATSYIIDLLSLFYSLSEVTPSLRYRCYVDCHVIVHDWK